VHTRFRFDSPDREEGRWIEMWARIIEEPSLITVGLQGEPEKIVRIVGVAGDVTDQQQAEEQTEALLEAEMAARRSAERARERAVLLSQASEMFSQTLASDAVIDSVAQFAVPSFSDACFAVLRSGGGQLSNMMSRIADAEVDASFRALQGRRAAEGWSGGLVDLKEVWFSEQAKLRTDITERDYRRAAMNGEHLAEYHRVGVRSVVAVPIRARGHLVGVMAFL